MNPEPVVLINVFEVPEGDDETFLDAWERSRAFLSTQEGYLSTRLHRSLSTSADFRFAFTSGVSSNLVCFERELMDHFRLVFERV